MHTPTLTNSQRLERKLALALPALMAASQRLLDHPDAHAIYPEYMLTVSWVNRTFVPLMETALERAYALAAEGDAVAAELAAYLEKHIEEESGEDILPDLELLGLDRATILRRPPPPGMAAAIGAQYVWILHYHPIAILGYLVVGEGHMCSSEAVEELIARTGYPRPAYTQLIEHAVRDIGHAEELHTVLDNLPLRPEHHEILGLSALQNVHLLSRALDEVFAQHDRAAVAAVGAH